MCFGHDNTNTNIANTSGAIAQAENARRERAFGGAFPFLSDRMTKGLPEFNALTDYSGGEFGRSSGIARNQVMAGLRRAGVSATDPAYTQTIKDFEASRARSYDDMVRNLILENERIKQFGAGGLASLGGASDPLAALALQLRAANA